MLTSIELDNISSWSVFAFGKYMKMHTLVRIICLYIKKTRELKSIMDQQMKAGNPSLSRVRQLNCSIPNK